MHCCIALLLLCCCGSDRRPNSPCRGELPRRDERLICSQEEEAEEAFTVEANEVSEETVTTEKSEEA